MVRSGILLIRITVKSIEKRERSRYTIIQISVFEHSRDTFYVSDGISFSNLRFENDVEMYGAQTGVTVLVLTTEFENDVEMYGAQTMLIVIYTLAQFENDVEMYGAQTYTALELCDRRFENDVEMYGAQTIEGSITG